MIVSRAGHAARGTVFVLIGIVVVQAVASYDPSEARGLAGALRALQGTSYGPWLLGLVAVGLFGYAASCAMRAKWFRLS